MSTLGANRQPDWLAQVLSALRAVGYAILEDVLKPDFLSIARDAMYRTRERILHEVGEERLQSAGETGVLRLMMRHESSFFAFLEIPEVLSVVDATVSQTAILHLQNGFILPSSGSSQPAQLSQTTFHMDFPRVLPGYLASINVFFAIDAFTSVNGGTVVVPGSHQKLPPPSREYLADRAVPLECPAGSMVVFDSTLWHAAGENKSGRDRLAINHQFTRSFFKQQLDYVRALGQETILAQKPRTQQLLGWYTRVPTSLDEYYRPAHERLYRKNQG